MSEVIDNGSPVPGPTGEVVAVSGSEAMVWLKPSFSARSNDALTTVGKFLGIRTDRSLVIGILTKVSVKKQVGSDPKDYVTGQLDLLGEVKEGAMGPKFHRGVTEYPMIGDPLELITNGQLKTIFGIAGPNTIEIGQLQQDASISAYIDVDETVSRTYLKIA
jgi:uncharacterized protein